MRIVNVRGTHGSGKTVLVRAVMSMYKKRTPVFIEGRIPPIGYVCTDKRFERLFVAGSYETAATGGCDTIRDVYTMYRAIRRHAKKDHNVLFEGIIAQHSTPNIKRLKDLGHDMSIVVIDIPVKESIRGVKKRRKKKGDTRPLKTENLRKEARDLLKTAERLREDGVAVTYSKTRRAATQRTLKLLGLT